MGFAELRESSQFEASGAQGLVWRHATAAVVLREHDEVRFEFLIEVAIEAAGPEERSNSRSHLFERCQHGGTPISHSCGLYRGVSQTFCGMSKRNPQKRQCGDRMPTSNAIIEV